MASVVTVEPKGMGLFDVPGVRFKIDLSRYVYQVVTITISSIWVHAL